jgi:hypothetical protein
VQRHFTKKGAWSPGKLVKMGYNRCFGKVNSCTCISLIYVGPILRVDDGYWACLCYTYCIQLDPAQAQCFHRGLLQETQNKKKRRHVVEDVLVVIIIAHGINIYKSFVAFYRGL